MNISELIYRLGIVPVIKIDDVKDAKPLAKALIEGGLPVAEVTFRTEAGKEAIKVMADNFPEMLVGAGTVLTIEQVDEAIEAGAKFIVSPGLNPEIVEYCIERKIPIFPGCATASEVEKALSYGLDVVKFFPAEANGGLPVIKALSGPFPQVRFMPTGGVNLGNLDNYLASDKIIACGGTWMVKDDLIKNQKFDEIRQISKDAVNKMLGFSIKHISIKPNGNDEAIAKQFANLLGLEIHEGQTSDFVDSLAEVMKEPCLGENGHIAIGTNNIVRALYHLEQKGFKFNENSATYDANNNLKAICLEDEIANFAIYLVQK